ncbi:MAG: 4Fe-4S dicluster domain-containing protein [Syntrophomonadaceae bacterium]|nr:4Fe-4S dicluster domain-containing protein [Syntrophomonadaceae bacterium]
MNRESSRQWVSGLLEQLDPLGLVGGLRSCLGCGKCVGYCPAAALTPSYNSRRIIRDVLLGNLERLAASEEIWRCLWCAGCYVACPMNIHFPLLMMLIRFKALELGYGRRYSLRFKRFARKAREEGITFTPGGEKLARLAELRQRIGLSPLPEVSERAKAEYKALFDLTGTTDWLDQLEASPGKEARLTYKEGKIPWPR